MKARIYWAYATRSLLRGGQRTVLALFCVAVGVMAIVGLQLVGNAVDGALTSNVRAGNGGDLSVRDDFAPFTQAQIDSTSQTNPPSFAVLQQQGVISSYTAISSHDAQTVASDGSAQFYRLRAVDPAQFPLVGQPIFKNPSDATFQSALSSQDSAIVTSNLATQLHTKLGDTVRVETQDGLTLNVTITGIVGNTGYFRSPQMEVSIATLKAAPNASGLPITYSVVYANVPGHTDANAAHAKTVISQDYPLANVTTTKDALQAQQNNVQQLRYFLQIVGLLALLIGGVGILNTMQVMLRRRQVEIAMLKTAGYQRRDLYVLFGLEAALLGIVGGAIGAAAGLGAAAVVESIVTKLYYITLPSGFSWGTVAAGVLIGFATALIFGLLPIVQASQIRPIAVLRGLSEGTGATSIFTSIFLSAVLVVLFFVLVLSILQNFILSLVSVIGAGIALLLLSLIFTLIVILVSRLPVPERLTWRYALLLVAGAAVSALIFFAVPALGILLGVLIVLGVIILVLPRTTKSNIKMALRNIGRQPGRTVTTLVALFIGVFAIGLILVLGQNIKDKINSALSLNLTYNSVVLAGPTTKDAVQTELTKLQSQIKGQLVTNAATIRPAYIDGQPIASRVPTQKQGSGQNSVGRGEALAYLSSLEGYDLSKNNGVPDVKIVQGAQDSAVGRNLEAADANTGNVIVPQRASLAPLDLKLGDTITVPVVGASQGTGTGTGTQPGAGSGTGTGAGATGGTGTTAAPTKVMTFTIVGFYTQSISLTGGGLYGSQETTSLAAGGNPFWIFELKVNPDQSTQVLNQIRAAVPTVQTFSVAELTVVINSLLNNLIIMLTAIASLAMIAGVIIIANAVALAMLERRREIGILKSVGYTSRSVLSEVLMENGGIGFMGSILAMAIVTFALYVLGATVFDTTFTYDVPIVVGIVLATAAVAMLMAALVAWGATRVRPLEVLRYE